MSDEHARRTSQYGWNEGESWTWEGTVGAQRFGEILAPVAGLVSECKIEISRNNTFIRAVDPAHVSGVVVDRKTYWDIQDPIDVGVNVSKLYDDYPPYQWGDDEHEVRIKRDPEGSKFRIRPDNDWKWREAAAFDPDTIRTADDFPSEDKEYEQSFTLPAPRVRGVLGAMAETSSDYVRLTPSDGEVLVEATKRNQDPIHSWRIPASVTAGESAKYSVDYVSQVARGFHPDGEVRVRFGADDLLELSNDWLRYVVAPRIEPGDSDE